MTPELHAHPMHMTGSPASSASAPSTPSSAPSRAATPPPRKRTRVATPPSPSDGDESAGEDGELTPAAERAAVAAHIDRALRAGGRDVLQKDARYFMMDNVVCSHCGVKGHLSFDCPEERVETRCFLCGRAGHESRNCPEEACFHCKQRGHKYRDCPEKNRRIEKRKVRRRVAPPRTPKLSCYVCNEQGHMDCSLAEQPVAVLSCYNCGMKGHAGSGCHQPGVDRVVNVVLEMDRERKSRRTSAPRGGKKGGKKGKDARNGKEGEKGTGKDKEKDKEESDKKMSSDEYRDFLFERLRQRRYGR